MTDLYERFTPGLTAPASNAVAVTPHDTNDLANATRALYVGTGGDVKVDMLNGGTVTFVNVADGTMLPIRVTRVYSTGTGASDIVGLY